MWLDPGGCGRTLAWYSGPSWPAVGVTAGCSGVPPVGGSARGLGGWSRAPVDGGRSGAPLWLDPGGRGRTLAWYIRPSWPAVRVAAGCNGVPRPPPVGGREVARLGRSSAPVDGGRLGGWWPGAPGCALVARSWGLRSGPAARVVLCWPAVRVVAGCSGVPFGGGQVGLRLAPVRLEAARGLACGGWHVV